MNCAVCISKDMSHETLGLGRNSTGSEALLLVLQGKNILIHT